MSKIANALLLLAATLLVLTLLLGVALLVREFTSGAFSLNAASGAWIQAGLSAAAVVFATLISRSFSKAVHNETLEREDRARERMVRRYLHPYEQQWIDLISQSPLHKDRVERIIRLLELRPWGAEFYQDQVERLVKTVGRAEHEALQIRRLARRAKLDHRLLAYMTPEDWDTLVDARDAIWTATRRVDDASAMVADGEPSPQQCDEAAALLRPAWSALSDGRRTIVDVFQRHGMMKSARLTLPPITAIEDD